MKKILQEKKGITLIALIITIIVLLILAVTAISAVQESDIIMYAKRAVSETEMAQIREQVELVKSEMLLESKVNTDIEISKATYLSKIAKKFEGKCSQIGDVLVIDEIYAVSVINSNLDVEVKEYKGVDAEQLLSLSYTASRVKINNETQQVTIKLNLKSSMSSTDYENQKKSQEKELTFEDMEQAVFDMWTEETSTYPDAKKIESIDDYTVLLLNNEEAYDDIFVDSEENRIKHDTMNGWTEDPNVLAIVKDEYPNVTELTPDLVNTLVHGYENYEEYIIGIYNNNLKEETDYISEYNDNTTNLSLYVNDETTPRVTNIKATVEGVDLGDYTLTNNGTIEFTIKNSEGEIVQFEKMTINDIISNKNEYYVSKEENSEWKISNGIIIKYLGSETSVTVPMYIGNERIVGVGINNNNARESVFNTSTEKVIIPNSVTNIGYYAFSGCTNLKSVTIPDSVTSMGYQAFGGCKSLTDIILPNTITTIPKEAFISCINLSNIIIPNSVITIEKEAFRNCTNLENIIIPNSVTTIEEYAFSYCENLRNVTISNSVTTIESYTFSDCKKLNNVIIPDSVTTIEKGAFSYCTSLSNITIPNSVKTLGGFGNCKSLSNITIPDSVTTIGVDAFADCTGLTNIIIPDSVTTISSAAFHSCKNLDNVIIPNSVTSIGTGAFKECTSLSNIKLSESITKMSDNLLSGCTSLSSITIPNSVTKIGGFVFYECTSLSSIIIPNSVTQIGQSTFVGCTNLESIELSNIITEIEKYLFKNCESLESITIPDSVTEMSNVTFQGCTNLSSIYFAPGNNPIPTQNKEPWGAPKGKKTADNPNGVHVEKLTVQQ